jgi:hypothetical protein
MTTIPAEATFADIDTADFTGGWRIVARKERGDHLRSSRFVILLLLLMSQTLGLIVRRPIQALLDVLL